MRQRSNVAEIRYDLFGHFANNNAKIHIQEKRRAEQSAKDRARAQAKKEALAKAQVEQEVAKDLAAQVSDVKVHIRVSTHSLEGR